MLPEFSARLTIRIPKKNYKTEPAKPEISDVAIDGIGNQPSAPLASPPAYGLAGIVTRRWRFVEIVTRDVSMERRLLQRGNAGVPPSRQY